MRLRKAGMADERWPMSKIELVHKRTPKLSAAFRKFWGAPPLLGFEGEEAYWSFAAAIVADMDPPDVVTLVLVKDFVDLSFQIRELRKHRGRLMEFERAKRLGTLSPKDAKAHAKYLVSPVGETDLFLASMEFFAAIDQLIANTERRRKDALAEVEFYREAVAIRLRRNAEAADAAMIEGKAVETEIHSTSSELTTAHGPARRRSRTPGALCRMRLRSSRYPPTNRLSPEGMIRLRWIFQSRQIFRSSAARVQS
jgi:hypothetical protein